MSRFLLYRLHEVNCSLMVCHDATVQAKSHSPNTALSVCEAVVHEPTAAHIHFAAFANASWAELAGVPSKDVNLQATPFEVELNGVTVQIEPHRLDVKGMHDLATGEGHDYPIQGTAYSVRSPVALIATGNAVAPSCAWVQCWKVRVRRKQTSGRPIYTQCPIGLLRQPKLTSRGSQGSSSTSGKREGVKPGKRTFCDQHPPALERVVMKGSEKTIYNYFPLRGPAPSRCLLKRQRPGSAPARDRSAPKTK